MFYAVIELNRIKKKRFYFSIRYPHKDIKYLNFELIYSVLFNVSAALRSASFECRHFDLKPKIIQIPNLR
jgi:hypothetical protein